MNGLRNLAGLVALWAGGAACAQTVELGPSAAVSCLSPAEADRGAPEYPFNAYKEGRGGRVKVALVFEKATEAPRVEVLGQGADEAFVEAVGQHVRNYRVPCLAEGRSARLLIDFDFQPDYRKVYWGAASDAADIERSQLMRCLVRPERGLSTEYPAEAARMGVKGRVVADMRFVAPDQPPEVETFSSPDAHELARLVRRWAGRWRMPCLTGEPVNTRVLFIFKLGDVTFGFPPMDLVSLLRATEGLERQTLALDTHSMGCPFELKLQYLQPFMPNVVGEVGQPNLAREPLLRWLRSVKLKLDRTTESAVFADTADLAVPCINIQLTPKEKTS